MKDFWSPIKKTIKELESKNSKTQEETVVSELLSKLNKSSDVSSTMARDFYHALNSLSIENKKHVCTAFYDENKLHLMITHETHLYLILENLTRGQINSFFRKIGDSLNSLIKTKNRLLAFLNKSVLNDTQEQFLLLNGYSKLNSFIENDKDFANVLFYSLQQDGRRTFFQIFEQFKNKIENSVRSNYQAQKYEVNIPDSDKKTYSRKRTVYTEWPHLSMQVCSSILLDVQFDQHIEGLFNKVFDRLHQLSAQNLNNRQNVYIRQLQYFYMNAFVELSACKEEFLAYRGDSSSKNYNELVASIKALIHNNVKVEHALEKTASLVPKNSLNLKGLMDELNGFKMFKNKDQFIKEVSEYHRKASEALKQGLFKHKNDEAKIRLFCENIGKLIKQRYQDRSTCLRICKKVMLGEYLNSAHFKIVWRHKSLFGQEELDLKFNTEPRKVSLNMLIKLTRICAKEFEWCKQKIDEALDPQISKVIHKRIGNK